MLGGLSRPVDIKEDVVRGVATPAGDATGRPLPQLPLRIRARNIARAVKRRLRSRRTLPRWTGPAAHEVQVSVDASRVAIAVSTPGALRVRLAADELPHSCRGLDLVVRDWQRPWPHWSGSVGPLTGLVHCEIRLPAGERGRASVSLELAQPLPVRQVIDAVLPILEPAKALPTTVSPDISVAGTSAPWSHAGLRVRPCIAAAPGEVMPAFDVLITQSPVPPVAAGTALAGSRYGVRAAGDEELIVVDSTAANPRGRQDYGPDRPIGELQLADSEGDLHWRIALPGREAALVTGGRIGDPLDSAQTGALALLGAVTAGPMPLSTPPAAMASVLAQLAMTGVVLHAPELPDGAGSLLAKELLAHLEAPLPGPSADPLSWELRSVAQRRAALRQHAAAFGVPAVAAGAYPSLSRPPAVTALLVSRRPQRAVEAVAALAAQTYPELEIVVGLHGYEASPAQLEQLRSHGLPVEVAAFPAELSFGEVLGGATRLARGSLITKVDDDDFYGPEHVWDLVLARQYSGADVVGKGAEFVYLEPYDVTVRRRMGSELYTDVVAGGTMLLSRGDLEDVGGWRPVARSVDRSLLDRVLRAGGLVYRTHGLGFLYTRHDDGHTWAAGLDYFMNDPVRRWSGKPPFEEFGPR